MLAVLAFTSALKIGMLIGLVFLVLWLLQRKIMPMLSSKKRNSSAKDALDNVDASLEDAKDYLHKAEITVEEDKEAAEEVLKQTKDLKEKVEEKKKIIP